MSYKYELGPKYEISVWDLDNPTPENVPHFFQPNWPDGTPWANKAEAENWAKALIELLSNPDCEFQPGDSPDQPLKPKPPRPEPILPEPLEGEIVDEPTA